MNLIQDFVLLICALSLLAMSVRNKTKTALKVPKINNVLNFLKLCYFLENIELMSQREGKTSLKVKLSCLLITQALWGVGEFERGQS